MKRVEQRLVYQIILGCTLIVLLVVGVIFRQGFAWPAHISFPVSTNSHLSLGDAVAALALIFAAYSISDRSSRVLLRIRGRFLRSLPWVLICMGLSCTLIAALLSQPSTDAMVLLNPLVWQLGAFVAFSTSPFAMLTMASQKSHLFNKRNAERFYHEILKAFSSGDPKTIEIATNIVVANLSDMAKCLDAYNKRSWQEIRKHKGGAVDYRLYARQLLETAFSDEQAASYVATKRIDFLWGYFGLIRDYYLRRDNLGDSFRTIVGQLLSNQDSYLYRQQQFVGTERYASVNDLVFGSNYLNEEFTPLKSWHYFRIDAKVRLNEQFCKVIIRAIETTLHHGAFSNKFIGDSVASAMFELNEYARTIVLRDKTPGKYTSNHRILMKIEMFYSKTFLREYGLELKAGHVSEAELKSVKAERYQQTLSAAYSDAYVEFLGVFASYPDDWTVHALTIFTLDGLFENDEYSLLRDMFTEYAWDAIRFSVEEGWYPAFVKIYMRIMYFKNRDQSKSYTDERKRLMTYVQKTLLPKLKSGTKMSNGSDLMQDALLSSSMTYDKKSNKLYWTDSTGSKKEYK